MKEAKPQPAIIYTPCLDKQPARGPPRAWEHAVSDEESLPESTASTLPSKVGAYRVDGRLGAGGMGEVYRGWDDKLDRPVAIKRVAPDAASAEESRRMFRREARAELAQDALRLAVPLRLRQPQPVSVLDHRLGLNEYGRSAR